MKRILYIDYLKTIAIFGVIAIHLSSKYITHYTLNASLWFSGLFVESMFRFSIILFVMASGILLIKKNQTIDDIPRRLKRIGIPFIGWFLIYFIIKMSMKYSLTYIISNIFNLLIISILDPTILTVEFWFIYMLIGLYLASPIICSWIRNAEIREIEYFLVIWLITIFIKMLPYNDNIIIYMNMFFGYVGYFILGYYLINKDSELLKSRKFGAVLYIIGTLMTFMGVIAASNFVGELELTFMPLGDLTINACLQAVGMFLIIKNTDFSIIWGKYSDKINRKITLISNLTLGIYLTNVLLINALDKIGIYDISISPFINIPILTVIVVFMLMIILLIMYRIPYVNKLTGIA